ncbi:MAG: HD domain-containing protein [Spirochaetales bacterium]|nr:HD domain-containing protein [Spirochaetales bacterium]
MISFKKEKWITVRKSNLKYYTDIDLYYKNKTSGEVLLYKSAGMHIADERLKDKGYSGDLYIRPEDKSKCLSKVHTGFSSNLEESMEEGVARVKEELINIIDETLHEPRSGGLEVIPDTMEIIVDSYSRQPDVIKNLAKISHSDYSTTIHSLNVMALTVGYCFYTKKPFDTTVNYGLTALFHDIGKTEIPNEILSAPRPLTDYEFTTMKNHTLLGAEILQANGKDVHCAIPGALEHHEKLDGRGYPKGQKTISEIGQILAIIDSYVSITNDERLYS